MTLGLAPKQADLLHTTVSYCEARIGADSIYAVLHRECFTLFPDEESWPLRLAAVEAGKWGAAVRDADDALMSISS